MEARRFFAAWTVLAIMAAAAIGLAGCGSDNSTAGGPPVAQARLAPVARPPVQDVPMPVGFRIDDSQSNAHMTGNVRYVSHYYRGREAKDIVANFYCENMQAMKWRQDGVWKNRGVWRLHFAKGNERADVTISENAWGVSTVYVEVYPVAMSVPPAAMQ